MVDRARALQICNDFRDEGLGALVPEPYLPYIPDDWSGVLVLAESQNLAGSPDYLQRLRALPSEDRMRRLDPAIRSKLSPKADNLGVRPWDDAHLKLAILAMGFGELRLDQVAVGNAVPWSLGDGSKNLNPNEGTVAASVKFWRELLPCLPELRAVITVGRVARLVFDDVQVERKVPLRSSSPMNIAKIQGMFEHADLLRRYPEVRAAIELMGRFDLMESPSHVFFACHAVSLHGKAMQGAVEV